MKTSVFTLAVLMVVFFSLSCTKAVMETAGGSPLREDEVEPWDPPWHKPVAFDAVFDRSDLIVFAEVVQVVNEVLVEPLDPFEERPVGIWCWFPLQAGSIKILRVLKGPQEFISKVINIEKMISDYYLEVGRRQVFFLEMRDGKYHTLVRTHGPSELDLALSAIKNLKLERGELNRGGTVVAVLSEALPLEGRRIHIFKGRLKAPVKIGDQSWEKYRIKTLKTDEFGVSEVELPDGLYTVLLELEGNLYSHHPRYPKGMATGYYAALIVENNWSSIFFRLERIRDKKGAQ